MNKNEMMAAKRQGDIVFKAMLDLSTAMHEGIINGDKERYLECLAGLKAMRDGIKSGLVNIGNLSYEGSLEFLNDDMADAMRNASTLFD